MIAQTLRSRRPASMVRPTLRPAAGGIVARIGPRGIVGIGAGSALSRSGPAGLVRPVRTRRAVRRYGPLRFLRRGWGMTSPTAINGLGAIVWANSPMDAANAKRQRDQEAKALLGELRKIIAWMRVNRLDQQTEYAITNRIRWIQDRLSYLDSLMFRARGVSGLGSWLSKAWSDVTGTKLSDALPVVAGQIFSAATGVPIPPGIIPGLNIPSQSPAVGTAPSVQTASFPSGPSTVLVSDGGELPKWVMPTLIGSAVLGGVGLLVALVKK